MDGCRCLLLLLLMQHSVCCVVIVSNRQPDALFSGACRFMAMHAADSVAHRSKAKNCRQQIGIRLDGSTKLMAFPCFPLERHTWSTLDFSSP
jgi:hypothetical protein